MAKHNILGKNGEKIAAEYLVKQGYDIRDINWRNGRYEIDIVATQGKYLVIVEVKTRQSDIFGLPEDAINDKKIRHLIDAADSYIKQTDLPFDIRFDIVSVICKENSYDIEHIQDAFYPPIQSKKYGY